MSGTASAAAYADARPVWAEVDLMAITHNVELLRTRVGRPVRMIAPVKANAYGHGVVEVGRHLQRIGVDGLATANLDDAIALRRAGVTTRILMYGSQLPEGFGPLLDNDLTPTVYDSAGVRSIARLAHGALEPIAVHVKVDSGLGRLGVRPEGAPSLVRELVGSPGLRLEGIYTHIPFEDADGDDWSRRRLAAFSRLVTAIEAEHGIAIEYAQGAASSVIAGGFPDVLNTIAAGHLMFGLCPLGGVRAETLGFRKALAGLRARLIHVGRREVGDDVAGAGPDGARSACRLGVILLGIDNGYRPARQPGTARVLVRGQWCTVIAVSAEYTVVDLTGVDDATVGDTVTVIGDDGNRTIAVEDVAMQLGAPSAAYWQVGLRNVPFRYAPVERGG